MPFPHLLSRPAILMLAGGGALWATQSTSITLNGLPAHVNCGQHCVLSASHLLNPEATWIWSVKRDLGEDLTETFPNSPILEPQPDGTMLMVAPELPEKQIYYIRVSDAADLEAYRGEVISLAWKKGGGLLGGSDALAGPLRGLAVDPAGGLFFAGYSRISKLDAHGQVSTVVQLPGTAHLALDMVLHDGRLFVADPARDCVRIINPLDGTMDTLEGHADRAPGEIRLELQAPGRDPGKALRMPAALCLGPDNALVVLQEDMLSTVDWGWVPRRPTLAETKAVLSGATPEPEAPEDPPPIPFRFGQVVAFAPRAVKVEGKEEKASSAPLFGPKAMFTRKANPGEAPLKPEASLEPFGPKLVFKKPPAPSSSLLPIRGNRGLTAVPFPANLSPT